jgi:hypothetical protein
MRWIAVPFPALGLALFGFFIVGGLRGPADYAISTSGAIVSAAALIHWVWFYYIEVTVDSLRQVRFFGLGNRTVPIQQIVEVDVKLGQNSMMMTVGTPCVRWSGGVIQLLSSAYWPRDFKRLIADLRSQGVPVTASAMRYFHVRSE